MLMFKANVFVMSECKEELQAVLNMVAEYGRDFRIIFMWKEK